MKDGDRLLPMRALFIIDIRSRELHPTTAVWAEQVICCPCRRPLMLIMATSCDYILQVACCVAQAVLR